MIQTTVGIDGMMCAMCEAHINEAVRKHFVVKSAKSNRRKKQCVILSENPLDEAQLRKVIADTGYEPLSIETKPYQRKGLFGL